MTVHSGRVFADRPPSRAEEREHAGMRRFPRHLTALVAVVGALGLGAGRAAAAPARAHAPQTRLAGPTRVRIATAAVALPRSGYALAGADGTVATFGASFAGAPAGLTAPIVGIATTPRFGYWLVASDGGIFSFGDARFFGSTGALRLTRPVVGMAATPSGRGYWLVASDGGLFTFGDASFAGSGFGRTAAPFVGMAVQRVLDPYTPGTRGYDISWPQCGGAYPSPPHAITIVGVNRGTMFTANPCLASEAAWAGGSLTLYVNAGGLPADSVSGMNGPGGQCAVADIRCRSYNWGRQSADWDVSSANSVGVRASMWWIDVETGDPWRSDDREANAQIVHGLLDGLGAHGLIAGIYSTSYQYGVLLGAHMFPNTPLWVPGARSASEAPSYCDPVHAFAGGVIWMTQWTETYDGDYACAI
jgi:hypothetical protein